MTGSRESLVVGSKNAFLTHLYALRFYRHQGEKLNDFRTRKAHIFCDKYNEKYPKDLVYVRFWHKGERGRHVIRYSDYTSVYTDPDSHYSKEQLARNEAGP